jgi:hypothetical protein
MELHYVDSFVFSASTTPICGMKNSFELDDLVVDLFVRLDLSTQRSVFFGIGPLLGER